MRKREQDKDKLREEFRKKNSKEDHEKLKEEKARELFRELDKINEVKTKIRKEDNIKAVKTYRDLIVQRYETVKLNGVEFRFRVNITALEFEERQGLKTPEERLTFVHRFLDEPKIPLEEFMLLPPEIPKYIEQKIMESFLQGLVQMAMKQAE